MVNWLMARKDYSAFVEIFGLPNSVVIMPPNIPVGKEADYQVSAEKVAQGISGALPSGSDVKFPGTGTRGEDPFTKFCGAQETDVVLAGTGGQLTMLSQPTGIGKGASEEHDGAWQTIARNKARRVNETLQRDFDAPELAAEFPGQPVCVYFELGVQDEEDVAQLMDTVVKAESVGMQTDVAEISERSGLKLVRATASEPEQVDGGSQTEDGQDSDPDADGDDETTATGDMDKDSTGKIANRQSAIGNPSTDLAATLQEMLLPLMKRLDAIAKIDDAAIQQHLLEKLLKDFPQIAAAITADDSLAKQLSPVLADALLAGLEGKAKG